MHGRSVRIFTNASGEFATACMPPCCVPRTPASKPISTRRRCRNYRNLRRVFAPQRNNCLNATWKNRKNFGALPSPASAVTSNPTKGSGSQRKPSTPGSGSSSCQSATPSSLYATIWRCGLGRIIHLSCTCPVC